MLMAMAQLPPGATLERTIAAQRQVEVATARRQGHGHDVFSVAGRSFSGNGQNTGMSFALLRDWSERRRQTSHRPWRQAGARRRPRKIRDANIFVMSPPLIRSLGTTSGFDLQLKDVGGVGRER